MKTTRKKEAVEIVEKNLDNLREIYRKLEKKTGIELDDPVADVRIIEKDDHVLVTYDGAGYDWFSYNCEYGMKIRDRLFTALEKEGFHAEDQNKWSLSIWEN